MRAYILRRLLLIVPSFLGITLIVFLVMLLTPGDPTMLALGDQGALQETETTKIHRTEMRKLYGLDKPPHVQYVIWLRNLVTLDFGRSFIGWRPISEKIAERLPVTLTLNVFALLIVYIIAIPIGIFAAVRQNTVTDRLITLVLFILYSMPAIWVGTMLMIYVGSTGWFPTDGLNSAGHDHLTTLGWLWDRVWHMVLPLVTLTYAGFASLSRYMRSSMLEVIRKDYIRTARAKGLTERVVVFKHALRNSLIPIVTISVMSLPGLLAGSIIVEKIFNINGMGLMMWDAVLKRDYYVVMAVTTISASLVLLSLVLVDVVYALVDPRISYD